MAAGKYSSWGSPGGFACRVTERDVALGSCRSASESLTVQQMRERRLVVKDNWYSSEYGRLPLYEVQLVVIFSGNSLLPLGCIRADSFQVTDCVQQQGNTLSPVRHFMGRRRQRCGDGGVCRDSAPLRRWVFA